MFDLVELELDYYHKSNQALESQVQGQQMIVKLFELSIPLKTVLKELKLQIRASLQSSGKLSSKATDDCEASEVVKSLKDCSKRIRVTN